MKNKTIITVPEALKEQLTTLGIIIPLELAVKLSTNIGNKMVQNNTGFVHKKTNIPVTYIGSRNYYFGKYEHPNTVNFFEISLEVLEAVIIQLQKDDQREILKVLLDRPDKSVKYTIAIKESVKNDLKQLATTKKVTMNELIEDMLNVYKKA